MLPPEWRRLTGTGFKDTTRLAAGSPELWQAIFLSNRPALLEALDQFRAHLESYAARCAATRITASPSIAGSVSANAPVRKNAMARRP